MTERELRYNAEIAKWCYTVRETFHQYLAEDNVDEALKAWYAFSAYQLYLNRLYEERKYPAYEGPK